eukprot:Hpha_TRINITY_DN35148_c0_g1::TRINITY_DN35148_c0_g1_i1::g.168409::m.168409
MMSRVMSPPHNTPRVTSPTPSATRWQPCPPPSRVGRKQNDSALVARFWQIRDSFTSGSKVIGEDDEIRSDRGGGHGVPGDSDSCPDPDEFAEPVEAVEA